MTAVLGNLFGKILSGATGLLLPVWSRLVVYAAAAGGVLASLAVVYWRIRRDAIKEVEARQTRARLDAVRRRKVLEDETQALPTGDLARRVDRWVMRDDTQD